MMCFVLLAATTVALGQSEIVLNVEDVSKAGVPLKIAGRVSAKNKPSAAGYESEIEMINVSDKSILLLVVRTDIRCGLPMNFKDPVEIDYFFDANMLQPGASAKYPARTELGGPIHKEDSLAQIEPSASAEVAFAQFSDGSSWGDVAAAEQMLKNRQMAFKELELLSENYRKRGEEEFLKELLKHTLFYPIVALQDTYRAKGDLSRVLADLDNMIEIARAHSTH